MASIAIRVFLGLLAACAVVTPVSATKSYTIHTAIAGNNLEKMKCGGALYDTNSHICEPTADDQCTSKVAPTGVTITPGEDGDKEFTVKTTEDVVSPVSFKLGCKDEKSFFVTVVPKDSGVCISPKDDLEAAKCSRWTPAKGKYYLVGCYTEFIPSKRGQVCYGEEGDHRRNCEEQTLEENMNGAILEDALSVENFKSYTIKTPDVKGTNSFYFQCKNYTVWVAQVMKTGDGSGSVLLNASPVTVLSAFVVATVLYIVQ